MTELRVLGCSDAFNSGGRFFPCFHVESASARFLIDCGPTALLAMKRAALDADALDAVLISHFHGDHIGGLPFINIELAILKRRARPLLVGGPPGIGERTDQVIEALYPALRADQRIRFEFVGWDDEETVVVGSLRVRAFPAIHTPETRPYALRIEVDGRVIAYSGDTEWTDALVSAADGADLFICEATTFETAVPSHLSYATVRENRERLRCKRLLLTHMSDDMLGRLPVEDADAAADGMRISL